MVISLLQRCFPHWHLYGLDDDDGDGDDDDDEDRIDDNMVDSEMWMYLMIMSNDVGPMPRRVRERPGDLRLQSK
jgi:hypothetical protein